jgi:hypothetical protein
MAVHKGMAAPSQTSRQDGMDQMAGTDYSGYKNGLDFIITLIVVNSSYVLLLHRLVLSYPIANKIGLSLSLINSDNSFPLRIARQTARLTAFSYL